MWENDYFRYEFISGSYFTHVLTDKKAEKKWLVHATGIRFPIVGDICITWFPAYYNPRTLEAMRFAP